MTHEQEIERLEEFKVLITQYEDANSRHIIGGNESDRLSAARAELRSSINKEVQWVKNTVHLCNCYKTVSISPPPATGGLAIQNADPFDHLFGAPYGLSVIGYIFDMVDQTIGVLGNEEVGLKLSMFKTIQQEISRGSVFVAMAMSPEHPELDDVLDAIKVACKDCNLDAFRIDEEQSNESITDRILEGISRAEFVVSDLTYSRPNVYYESGYSHALGKVPIFIAKRGTRYEFDVQGFPVIEYDSMRELKKKLGERLVAISQKDS